MSETCGLGCNADAVPPILFRAVECLVSDADQIITIDGVERIFFDNNLPFPQAVSTFSSGWYLTTRGGRLSSRLRGNQMDKSAIAICTCIVILYLLDAAFFNGQYFDGVIRTLAQVYAFFR